jgi:uncharacterized protein
MAKSFDDIEVRRPKLAKSYLELIRAQTGRPLAMFAPRRIGKTYFLDHDLAPAARRTGWLPVYADLWLQKSAPLAAINHALEEALDDATVPKGAAARMARTPVKKLGLMGASLDLGDEHARRALPASPELRLDALVVRLATAANKPLLLMLDEAQTLADVASGGEAIIAALRAVLHKRREIVSAVFTGSSQAGLVRMLSTAGSPMYQFAQLLTFPALGDEFLAALAAHFVQVHRGKSPGIDAMRRVFAHISNKPGLMRDLVKTMSAEGLTDPDEGLRRYVADERHVAGWTALLQPLGHLDRLVLRAIALGQAPLGRAFIGEASQMLGTPTTIAKLRATLDRLRRMGLIRRDAGGPAAIEDPLFSEYLERSNLDALLR